MTPICFEMKLRINIEAKNVPNILLKSMPLNSNWVECFISKPNPVFIYISIDIYWMKIKIKSSMFLYISLNKDTMYF